MNSEDTHLYAYTLKFDKCKATHLMMVITDESSGPDFTVFSLSLRTVLTWSSC